MPRFIRAFVPGGSFFLTLVTLHRRSIFQSTEARDCLRRSMLEVQHRRPFQIEGLVLLHDHLHFLITLPPGDGDFSTRIRKIKEGFTRGYLAVGDEARLTAAEMREGRRGVWQPRFWEHTIRDEVDFGRHMDYIHFNPVKHGHVACPHDWAWSTFSKWVAEGVYENNWLCRCGTRLLTVPDFHEIAESALE